jgi:hypothetical protein
MSNVRDQLSQKELTLIKRQVVTYKIFKITQMYGMKLTLINFYYTTILSSL